MYDFDALQIHGIKAVLMHAKRPNAWEQKMSKRRSPYVVMMARANKMARTIWALLAHDRPCQRGYLSVKPG
jgi:transposase